MVNLMISIYMSAMLYGCVSVYSNTGSGGKVGQRKDVELASEVELKTESTDSVIGVKNNGE